MLPAEPALLGRVRNDVRSFLSAEVEPDTVDEIVLAVNEACANACLHAYPALAGPMTVRIESTDHHVSVEVEDTGHGLEDRAGSPGAGLGMTMMRELSSDLTIASGPSGTVVRLLFDLHEPVAGNGAG